MRHDAADSSVWTAPHYLAQAHELVNYMRTLDTKQLAACMQVSEVLAQKVHEQYAQWQGTSTIAAVHSFVGDIYSGLQSASWDRADMAFAQEHLWIISGLYGLLRPLDAIEPYRLEMGYRLPDARYGRLDQYWTNQLPGVIAPSEMIINLTAVEYSKALGPQLAEAQTITPVFLTISPKTGEPTFVTVHTKIARGAFANWLIRRRVTDRDALAEFNDLGYAYDHELSIADKPTFICRQFGGLGLSVRLRK